VNITQLLEEFTDELSAGSTVWHPAVPPPSPLTSSCPADNHRPLAAGFHTTLVTLGKVQPNHLMQLSSNHRQVKKERSTNHNQASPFFQRPAKHVNYISLSKSESIMKVMPVL
jgi:hypothetical protein